MSKLLKKQQVTTMKQDNTTQELSDSLLIDSPLGKETTYHGNYNPSLLFAIPRTAGRKSIGLGPELPFEGVDIWTGYELSWLNNKGKPQIAMAEFQIPCTSTNIVESKSFKLYLNSFNQSRFDSFESVNDALETDLSAAAAGSVTARLILPEQFAQQRLIEFTGLCIDNLDIDVDTYNEISPTFLKANEHEIEEKIYSHLLKSNCPVTGQPDWATLFIHYKGKQIDHPGLLKYIISFRNHHGFHEQCVEKIYLDLMHHCHPRELSVYARYTRRGGLDINPFRSSIQATPPRVRLCRQ